MNFTLIGFLGSSFIGFTLLNRIIEGAWIKSADVAIMQTLTITQNVQVGFFSIPVPNTSYISGLMRLVQWDYSFFGGNAQIIQFFLYSLTFAVAVSLLMIILGVIVNYFRPR